MRKLTIVVGALLSLAASGCCSVTALDTALAEAKRIGGAACASDIHAGVTCPATAIIVAIEKLRADLCK